MSAALFGVVAVALVGGVFALLGIDAKATTDRDRKANAWLEADPANRRGSAEWRAWRDGSPAAPQPTPDPEPVVVELPPAEVAVIVHREEGAA